MRRAGPGDLDAIAAYLGARAATSMFPLSNLMKHGMDGDHDRSISFWIAGEGRGLTDVVGVTREGMVMPSCDTTPWDAVAEVLRGHEVIGVIGATAQARPLIRAFGLTGAATELDADEPHFALDLDALILPEGEGRLVPLSEVDRDLMVEWRRAYALEVLGVPPERAGPKARADIDAYRAADSHRVLVAAAGPLCLTGFNAEAHDIVQVGGVFTPPPLRSRGHARRAVALHLAEARDRGMRRATLFASGEAAVRAYRAIGFQRVGDWTLFLTAGKERVGG